MNKSKINPGLGKLPAYFVKLRRYSFVIFISLVATIYAAVVYRIDSLSNIQPSDGAISSQVKAARVPKFNQNIILQLQGLRDHSVNVQTLFNSERTDPFQENN